MRKLSAFIFVLFLYSPLHVLSQGKLYFIDKPSIAKPYKQPKSVFIITQTDGLIGNFISQFVNNLSAPFEVQGIEVHKLIKTPFGDPDKTLQTVDSIFLHYNPDGIILLTLNGKGIMKSQTFGQLRQCLEFDFQYSYRKDDEKYIHMYMTKLAVDLEKIDQAEPSTSIELLRRMRKKKVI